MKPTPEIIKIPDKLVEMAKEYTYCRLIHKEVRDGKVWAFAWEKRRQDISFEVLIILYENGKTWYSWDGSKWGKKMLIPMTEYRKVFIDSDIDKKIHGKSIEEIQDGVRSHRQDLRNKKKKDLIDMMIKNEKPIPDSIKKRMHKNMPHFILFDTKDRKTGYCTMCESYHRFDRLVNGEKALCPKANTLIDIRSIKKAPQKYDKSYQFIQKSGEMLILRIVNVHRYNIFDAVESQDETVRAIVTPDGRQIWYEKRGWGNDDTWFVNNIDSWTKTYNGPFDSYIRTKNPVLVPENIGSIRQWSDMFKVTSYTTDNIRDAIAYYTDKEHHFNTYGYIVSQVRPIYCFVDIYERLIRYPQIETFLKLGFYNLLKNIPYEKVNHKQKEIHKFLGIKKETWRILLSVKNRRDVTYSTITLFKEYEKLPIKPDRYIALKTKYNQSLIEIHKVCSDNNIPFKKIIKYLDDKPHSIWLDYIQMSLRMGSNVSDTFVCMPHDLNQAHDALIEAEETAKLIEEQEKENKKILSFRRSLKKFKEFKYETDDYIIRPALSPGEIVKEGQDQHNCVGRAGYIDKMIKGKSAIIFLRLKSNPSESYYTVEMSPTGRIIQAYTKYNKKTDDYETKIMPALMALQKKVRNEKHNAAR